jgi:hypothetical protein
MQLCAIIISVLFLSFGAQAENRFETEAHFTPTSYLSSTYSPSIHYKLTPQHSVGLRSALPTQEAHPGNIWMNLTPFWRFQTTGKDSSFFGELTTTMNAYLKETPDGRKLANFQSYGANVGVLYKANEYVGWGGLSGFDTYSATICRNSVETHSFNEQFTVSLRVGVFTSIAF